MKASKAVTGVWFPDWAEVLSRVRLKELDRRTYRLAIVEYLSFCKRSRQRATVASARSFMAEVEARRRLGRSQLAAWKGALNWFFKLAGSRPTNFADGRAENFLTSAPASPAWAERGPGAAMDPPAAGCAWRKEPPPAASDRPIVRLAAYAAATFRTTTQRMLRGL